VLQHLAHNTFADSDVPRETDNVFVCPTTHGYPSKS
jgi:hypothetical protein